MSKLIKLFFLLLIIATLIYFISSSFRQIVLDVYSKVQKGYLDITNRESGNDLQQSINQEKVRFFEKFKIRGRESIKEIRDETPKIWNKLSDFLKGGKEIISSLND